MQENRGEPKNKHMFLIAPSFDGMIVGYNNKEIGKDEVVLMEQKEFSAILSIGETIAVEFKRAGDGIENDTYETVCSFLNRFGGDIFLGVEDDGNVRGISSNATSDMIKNFISIVSNPAMFSPTTYLVPEIMTYEGKTIIHIHVPPSAEVHRFKKVIYDRVDDADIKVTATSHIASMYIRKQSIYTEKKVYPYVTLDDLRLDLMPRIRKLAINNAGGKHPWQAMSDEEILMSAGLYGEDKSTGQKGFNLAAVMLLGRDKVILDVCPAYRTDAILRKVNIDRYDDRLIVQTNLVESFDLLMEFAEKHLWDKFFLEGTERKSLRNTISREMLVNTLIHREMTSSYIAKFVIEMNQMYVENANRAARYGIVTPTNFEPNPKNPIIAAFFRNIGFSDQLGSGVRNLFKYSKYYSGQEPTMIEGDIFRIIVPLNDEYSYGIREKVGEKVGEEVGEWDFSENQLKIIKHITENPHITARQLADYVGISTRKIEVNIKKLKEIGKITRIGSPKNGYYQVNVIPKGRK